MYRRILFVRQIPQTIRMLCYGLIRSSSAVEVYSRCSVGLPSAAAYYLNPWLQALSKGDSEAVSYEAERLWKIFRRAPVVRMFINLIFIMPYGWNMRHCLCDLLISLGNLPGHTWLLGKVPDELLYMEGALIREPFTGLEQIQLLLYQSPCGCHGKCLRACLNKVLRAAGSNPLIQADVLGEIMHCCKGFGEMNVVLYAALLIFGKEQERSGCEEPA